MHNILYYIILLHRCTHRSDQNLIILKQTKSVQNKTEFTYITRVFIARCCIVDPRDESRKVFYYYCYPSVKVAAENRLLVTATVKL
jgi:hypothetical protein